MFQNIIFNDKINKCACWKFKQWNKLKSPEEQLLSPDYIFVLIFLSDLKMVKIRSNCYSWPSFIHSTKFSCAYIFTAIFSLKNTAFNLFQNYIRVYWNSFWIISYHHWLCIWNNRILLSTIWLIYKELCAERGSSVSLVDLIISSRDLHLS